jgi:hypothetical protein
MFLTLIKYLSSYKRKPCVNKANINYIGYIIEYRFFFILSELTQIVTDVISDPTLPRTADHPCK